MISNPNNPTIRAIRKLRKRRVRGPGTAILVEGHRALAVAIRSAFVGQVVHTPEAVDKRRALLRNARRAGATLVEVTAGVMATLTSVDTAPDVLGVSEAREVTLEEAVRAFGLGTVLAGVRDPATAGSILASCAAAGGTVAIATTGTTDVFAAKPLRSGAGAHFVLRIATGVEPAACAEALRNAGVRIVAISSEGDDPGTLDLAAPLAVVVGEDAALPEPLAAAAERTIRVGAGTSGIRPPLAAEAAVVLFEAARRNGDR